MKFDKKDKKCLLLILLLSFISLIFVNNNDFLYKKEILDIKTINLDKEDISYNPYGFKEKYKTKTISGIITNGKNKGNYKSIKYDESSSSVVTEKYKIGDKVFIESNEIDGLKRDGYVVFIIDLVIILLFILAKYRGLLTSLNVVINVIIFYLSLDLYLKGFNLLILCILESILFTIISLIISSGKNKKTLSAIYSTILSTLFLLVLCLITIKITNYSGTNFSEMSFLTVPFEDIFICELLLGGLGAVMDVSITMSSSISELIEKNNNISVNSLYKSGKEIGKDIMSTMMNVLFFTYLSSGLPIFILALRNGYTIYNYITNNYTIEITRFLVGSIGIVITVPISLFVSIKMFKGGKK